MTFTDSRHEWLHTKCTNFLAAKAVVETKIRQISIGRILTFLLILVSGYYSFEYQYLLAVTLVLIFAFAYLLSRHAALFLELQHLKAMIIVVGEEIDRVQFKLHSLNPGTEWEPEHHPYSKDLDLFEVEGLFAYLNRSGTVSGMRHFANRLLAPFKEVDAIQDQQLAVKELSKDPEFCLEAVGRARQISEMPNDRADLVAWVKNDSPIRNLPVWVIIGLPILTCTVGLASFFISEFQYGLYLLVGIQWTIRGRYNQVINEYHEQISRSGRMLREVSSLMRHWSDARFESKVLINIMDDANRSALGLQELGKLITNLNARLNVFTSMILNSLILYDVRCIYKLDQWRSHHGNEVEKWLTDLDTSETLVSFACYAWQNPDYTYARFEGKDIYSAKDLGHPLISSTVRIVNDVDFGNPARIRIVTGANMAGKSTFLRSIGVNYILAANGVPVCATSFVTRIMDLRSGMRTNDSLAGNASYFFAELSRLEQIITDLRSGTFMLLLLDEMLKGTNSTDKLKGSIGLVKQLKDLPCIAVIATHDLALGDLEEEFPDKIENNCFEADFVNETLVFNYKFKPGKATRMNATFLMRKMGILPD